MKKILNGVAWKNVNLSSAEDPEVRTAASQVGLFLLIAIWIGSA